MTDEENKAIEYYRNKEVSFTVNGDIKKLLETLGITEEDSFENHQIRFKTLLNLIEKQQKEIVGLKEENRHLKIDKTTLKQDIETNYIRKSKIERKINQLEIFKKALPIRAVEIERFIDELKQLLESEE